MNCIEELSDDSCKAIDELSETPNADNLNNTVSNQELQRLYQMYCDFKESVRTGSLGKTAMLNLDELHGHCLARPNVCQSYKTKRF